MKIAFPLLNKDELAIDFSHSDFIGIYDIEKNEIELLDNQSLDKKLKTMELFKNMMSDGLIYTISPFYNYVTLRIFKDMQLKPLKAKGIIISENIRFFKESKLKPFETSESLLTGECAKDCMSCGPDCTNN